MIIIIIHLRDDSSLDFSVRLVAFGRNGVNLIDEDDCGCVLFRLLERLAQIRLRFTRHFRHDFGAINQKEKRTRLVRHRAGNQRFTYAILNSETFLKLGLTAFKRFKIEKLKKIRKLEIKFEPVPGGP